MKESIDLSSLERAAERDVDESTPPPAASTRRPDAKRRFRARRIRVDDLGLGQIKAFGRHPALGPFEARVEDLSVYGMALVLPLAHQAPVLLAGDRLEELRVMGGDTVLSTGTAVVRHVAEREAQLVVGVELEGDAIDVAELYRRGERYGFAERLRSVARETRLDQISPAFKAWVAELRTYLETMRHFLDEEERRLDSLDQLTRHQALAQYIEEAAPVIVGRMNRAARELAELVSDLPIEQHAAHRALLRKHVLPLIRLSPLLRRAHDKPCGYAGDYEIMNMLYRDHAEGESLFARVLNIYGAQESAAQANINRIAYLSHVIERTVQSVDSGRLRVASVGCGPAREILAVLERDPSIGRRIDVTLIDQEEHAIKYCERTLGPIASKTGARVHYVRESVRRLLTERQLVGVLGRQDLIYSAGLFDYLNGRTFATLLRALYDALGSGGTLIVGNVATENPSRWFMEYCLDWFLIHRSREELLQEGTKLDPTPRLVEVGSEPLGVNLFLTIRR